MIINVDNANLNFALITFYDNQRTTPNLVGLQLAGCNVMNDAGVYRKFYPESQDIQVHKLVKGESGVSVNEFKGK